MKLKKIWKSAWINSRKLKEWNEIKQIMQDMKDEFNKDKEILRKSNWNSGNEAEVKKLSWKSLQ
jgi:hypothetical protein